jgi:hypothetical protein
VPHNREPRDEAIKLFFAWHRVIAIEIDKFGQAAVRRKRSRAPRLLQIERSPHWAHNQACRPPGRIGPTEH